ncbi:MAG: tRNA (adenosine(37)-N6)-threonylcarbamoyltransferase complex dimerization subunit type 1 TsaB [Bacilli bacterium]|nr:tRNA (adenosine(37)-N6)-threonylcarbamoyltransferase complex dimerization subunit type 1 TsaB [Bacilli bacterium]
MIKVLLDSSNTSMSVGLIDDKHIIASTSYEAWQRQSEVMIPELNKLLDDNGFTKDDIEGVIVAIGPGSYTGVRIAITIAKTMSVALNIPIYPVSSLQVLKDGNNPSICLINARSKRSYIGVYHHDQCLLKDGIMTNDEVNAYIKEHPTYSICGNVEYLGIAGKTSDIIQEMFSLKDELKPLDNPLALTPIYLKD